MTSLSLRCTVCRALLDEEDLFCPNCGTEAPSGDPSRRATQRTSTHNFNCSSCGASMSYDASAGQLRCPFCGGEQLEAQPDATVPAPERVVPFAIGKDEAVARMQAWLGRGFWRPGDLQARALVVKMASVYVPYWVFAATTHTYWCADSSHTPAGARASWYPMTGEHEGHHAGVLIGASGALSAAETSAICPFDLSAGVPPEQVDLDRVIVEQFSVPRKYARPLAKAALELADAAVCRVQHVPGNERNLHVNVKVRDLTSEPVLLPVWIMAYRYRDTVYRFLLNGQNGQATGQAPLSYWKIAAAVGLGVAVVLAILAIVAR